MARPPVKELTDRELEVMHVFWEHGEQTAAEARDYLAAAGLDRAYPTVANLVRILHEKGFLHAINGERPFRYRPARTYEDVSGRLLGDVVRRVFAGSRADLLTRLVEKSLVLYEEGIRLSRLCHAKLEEAEGKIELLLKDSRGEIALDAAGRPKKAPFTGGNG